MTNARRDGARALGAPLAVLMLLAAASRAVAFPSGVSTLNFGALGCNQCHSGGQTPTVTLTGPVTVAPDSTNEYTLQINNTGSQTFGGFNVSAPFGTLSRGGANSDQTQLTSGTDGRTEVTHLGAKPSAGGQTTFSFLWTAPGSFSSVSLSAWGNAVNGDGRSSGDRAALATLAISSTAPGANPTATPTATPIATPTLPVLDAVVAPVRPVNIKIAPGRTSATKRFKIKVTNANPMTETVGRSIVLVVSSGCPEGFTIGSLDFGTALGNSVFLNSGKSKRAKVEVTVSNDAVTSLNRKDLTRCTLAFEATSPGTVDPNPTNNRMTVEVNVRDQNDAEQAAVEESFVQSLGFAKVTLRDGSPRVKVVRAKVGSADIIPTVAKPGHEIVVTASDGDCPPGTVGMIDFKTVPPDVVIVKGGRKKAGRLPLTITGDFASASTKSPARCTAVVTATGPSDPDPDPTNNTTRLIIDVIDRTDFW